MATKKDKTSDADKSNPKKTSRQVWRRYPQSISSSRIIGR